ncbi:MAG: hypothetical protein KAI64_03435 [Thermoplasmata archaeon]|nr:hypothetical protein [Thermoplasmata archaeon]
MKVLITDVIAKEAIEMLKEKHEVDVRDVSPNELLECIKDYDALIVRTKTKVTKEVIDNGEKLKVIAMAGIGFDHINVAHAETKGIVVVNAPSGSTYSVAELAVGHMISIARFLPRADRTTKEGHWEKTKLKGAELYGKTLGIIGLGRIGKQVALRARAFEMDILAYDPYVSPDTMSEYGTKQTSLDELLMKSDFVTLHAALTEETRGMLNHERLAKMKKSAYIINAARGAMTIEKDLVEALEKGTVAGIAMDVYEKEPPKDSPLLKLDNVALTPHLGASTREGQKRAGTIVAGDVLGVLEGKKAENVIDLDPYSKMKRYQD